MIRRPPSSPLFPYPPLSRPPPAGAGPGCVASRGDGGGFGRGSRSGGSGRAGRGLPFASRPRTKAPPVPRRVARRDRQTRSEEHTSELQSLAYLVCRLLLEKK